jgi:peroxiredoxin Q/BCP
MRPRAGDPAPDFRGVTTDGTEIGLADFRGTKLVLYFYPMDFTPGCTAQACSLRDRNADIRAKGAQILGVSTQDAASHNRFTQTHRLNFPLLADADRSVARAYGAIGGGGLFGFAQAMMGLADRVTFIIDEQGTIAHVIGSPSVMNHAEEVLARL